MHFKMKGTAMSTKVSILRLPHYPHDNLPSYATPGAAGMDLAAAIISPLEIAPGRMALVPTGVAVAIPYGFEGQVRPRSGLATKHLLLVPNSPGTIDSDYRGEVRVALLNLGDQPYRVEPGSRVAQLVVAAVARVEWDQVSSLPDTSRGSGGFGHTGV